MDLVKEAFQRIKLDFSELRYEIDQLKAQIAELNAKIAAKTNLSAPTNNTFVASNNPIHTNKLTDTPTVPQEIRGSKPQFSYVSTGNEGVPTDNLTVNQTVQQTDNFNDFTRKTAPFGDLQKIQETLDSLDAIRKEIRLKFKRLTPQEMQVFTTLYSLEERGVEEISYGIIATHLSLSESSIRDYITKLLLKGIPISKKRLNNKKIILSVSNELKRMANLSTIIRLREL